MVIDHGKYYDVGNWTWTTKFAWLPARMDSGEHVWWREYYHGIRVIFGPAGESAVVLHQYMTIQEFTWSALKDS
jgi:hypothetical protein